MSMIFNNENIYKMEEWRHENGVLKAFSALHGVDFGFFIFFIYIYIF